MDLCGDVYDLPSRVYIMSLGRFHFVYHFCASYVSIGFMESHLFHSYSYVIVYYFPRLTMSLEPLAVMFQFLTLVGDSFLVDQIFTYILVTIQRQDTQDDLTFLYMLDFLT